jgi:hypothetical protein
LRAANFAKRRTRGEIERVAGATLRLQPTKITLLTNAHNMDTLGNIYPREIDSTHSHAATKPSVNARRARKTTKFDSPLAVRTSAFVSVFVSVAAGVASVVFFASSGFVSVVVAAGVVAAGVSAGFVSDIFRLVFLVYGDDLCANKTIKNGRTLEEQKYRSIDQSTHLWIRKSVLSSCGDALQRV